MPDETQDILRVPETYVLDAVLTALATLNFTIQIQQKADFEWVQRIASSTGRFKVNIKDAATGRTLITNSSNGTNPDTVNDQNYFGTAQLPNPLLQPYVFARSSSISVTLTDTSNAGNTIQIVFDGFDLYPAGAPGQGASGALVKH